MATTEYTPGQLRQMDESEARTTLTVAQYDRWEKMNELHEQAEETKSQWEEENQQIQEITVSADMDQLGTEVDLFGNDVLVHVDSGDREFQRASGRLDDLRSEFDDDEDIVELEDELQADIAEGLQDMLDAVLVRWDGTRWSDIPEPKRGAVLNQCRSKWGVDGLLLGWVRIVAAIDEERGEMEDLIESFRGP